MTEKISTSEFCTELDKRLDEVIAWAVMNCPLSESNLAYADFEKVRFGFQQVVLGRTKSQEEKPEPEDGGPQYINDNPAPWP